MIEDTTISYGELKMHSILLQSWWKGVRGRKCDYHVNPTRW